MDEMQRLEDLRRPGALNFDEFVEVVMDRLLPELANGAEAQNDFHEAFRDGLIAFLEGHGLKVGG